MVFFAKAVVNAAEVMAFVIIVIVIIIMMMMMIMIIITITVLIEGQGISHMHLYHHYNFCNVAQNLYIYTLPMHSHCLTSIRQLKRLLNLD